MISPASTNEDVTKIGDYIFRICFIDPFQGNALASFAKKSLGAKRAAILQDTKQDYSIGLANAFRETFRKSGGDVVSEQAYSSGDKDFRSALTSIRATNPDVIFSPINRKSGALVFMVCLPSKKRSAKKGCGKEAGDGDDAIDPHPDCNRACFIAEECGVVAHINTLDIGEDRAAEKN